MKPFAVPARLSRRQDIPITSVAGMHKLHPESNSETVCAKLRISYAGISEFPKVDVIVTFQISYTCLTVCGPCISEGLTFKYGTLHASDLWRHGEVLAPDVACVFVASIIGALTTQVPLKGWTHL